MGWKLNAPSGGSVELYPADTASNVTFSIPGDGQMIIADADTGAALIPSGYTFQRPPSPSVGMARVNKDSGAVEIYNGAAWG
jgi:hypothetical protein